MFVRFYARLCAYYCARTNVQYPPLANHRTHIVKLVALSHTHTQTHVTVCVCVCAAEQWSRGGGEFV